MWYRAGTCSVTNGSDTVTGTNTLWLTNAKAGDAFAGPDGKDYEITEVTSNTALKIKQANGTAAYAGTTQSAQPYAIKRNFTNNTTADLAQRLVEWQNKHVGTEDELAAWNSGTATGGPNSDGQYPLTNQITKVTTLVDCPAKMEADIDAWLAGAQAQLDAKAAKDSPTITTKATIQGPVIADFGLPNLRPSLLLDFARGVIDPRITFTRNSIGTYFDAQGVLRTALAGVPRIDYDPVTGRCLGLLVEEQRTNLVDYSEQFSGWTKVGATVTDNATTAPDGTATADKLVEDTSTGGHRLTKLISVTNGTTYTFSPFLKAGERTFAEVMFRYDDTNYGGVCLNLLTGAMTAPASPGVNLTSVAVVQTLPNGWYRVAIPRQYTGSASTYLRIGLMSDAATNGYPGDGASGIYVWGAQFEAGAFTSYIPTTSSQVTRAADVASMTGAAFSSWYRQDEGTFVTDWRIGQDITSVHIIRVDDGSDNNHIRLRYNASGTNNDHNVKVAGSDVASLNTTTQLSLNTNYRTAMAYKTNDFARSVDGGTVLTDTDGATPSGITTLRIGSNHTGSEQPNAHIARLAYYPKAVANSENQALAAA